MKRIRMIAVLAVLISMLMTAGCGSGSGACFTGSKTVSRDGLYMEYSLLDREETHDIELSEGELLHVEFSHTSGNVDVLIGINGKDYLFRGSGQENGGFDIEANETGTYHISVTGHKAAGKISFARAAENGGTQ